MSTTKPSKKPSAKASRTKASKTNKPSRIDLLQQLLTRMGGASIAEMSEATGWQQHSVRGAMAGSLKKRGLTITSDKVDGTRRYHAAVPA